MKTIPAYSRWDGGISAHQQLIHTGSGVHHLAISEQTDDRGSNVSRRVRLICDVLDRWREASNIVLGWCQMMSPLGVWIGRWKAMRTICPKIAKIVYERARLTTWWRALGNRLLRAMERNTYRDAQGPQSKVEHYSLWNHVFCGDWLYKYLSDHVFGIVSAVHVLMG